jgi:PAS domain S-box-containing protein
MRVACSVFLAVYTIIVVVRYEESHHAFFELRLLICLYAAFGVWLARRVTWWSGRAYTVGLAFLLPLQAAYIDGVLGNHVAEVAVSALATFVPIVFLQAGWDFIVVALGLVGGHALVLSLVPPPAMPLSAVAVMLGGAIATGTVAGLQTLIYRVRWSETVDQLEHALAVSAEWKNRYEAASLASGQVLYDWDPHTNVVSYGGAHERILGYTVDELAGDLSRWTDLVHPDDRAAFDREIGRTLEQKAPFHLRYRARRKDGVYIVVEDSGRFVFDDEGGIVRLVGFVSDVTERTMAEEARAEEAATSAALAHVGRELISSLETPVVLERLCRLTTEVLGCDCSHTWLWRPEEQVHTPIASYGVPTEEWGAMRELRMPLHAAAPVFADLGRDGIAEIGPESGEFWAAGALLAGGDGSRVLCVALHRGGEMVGIHAAGYRTRSAPFTAAQKRLARGIGQLASMAVTNAQLVEKLERASRLKSEFVSTMSHELRTPLNVILGYTDMLADLTTSDDATSLLARVRHSALELLEMIEATLDLNRLAAGKDAPRPERVRLRALWEELEAEFAALPRKTEAVLRWECPAGIETLDTDRRKLKMIVKNLVGNALKFTPAGEVVARWDREGDVAVMRVRDTGIGIRREHLADIFEMFRQVDSSDHRSYGGVGLGLYIVRQLVDQLGGTIAVDSEPGRGSTFCVRLPADADARSAGLAA